jgi:signal transduction histidine kinase
MSFYDATGHLLDVNNKMLELCHIENIKGHPFTKTSLFDFPNIKGVYTPGSRDVMHVCQHLREPSLELDKYIEFRIHPVITDDNKLVYYIVTCRDITAERNVILEQRAHDRRLQATNDAISRYERQLHYLLEESHMYIWTYRPSENVVRMTRSPGITEFSETIEDYLGTIDEEFRQQAAGQIRQAMAEGKAYVTIMPFASTPLDPNHSWYSVSGMPIFDKDGQLKEYFGLARNITDLMEAQQQLRVETERAENSGRLKAAFLANMTHEIRTPLNAIVGFSSLLQAVDTDEERHEFIRIIRNNCDMLLRLINDILEASSMGQSLAIEPKEIDLACIFDDICRSLEQRVESANVQFLKDNPYTTYPAVLDSGRLQQLLTNFVTNAVKYT